MFFADMGLSYLITLYLAIAVVNPAALEPPRDPCAEDVAQYCFGWTSDQQKMDCLKQRRADLSRGCAKTLPRELAAWERGPCAKERRQLCAGEESDRVARLCLLQRFDRLSSGCRDELDGFLLLDPCSIERGVYCGGAKSERENRCLVQYASRLTEECRRELMRDPESREAIQRTLELQGLQAPGRGRGPHPRSRPGRGRGPRGGQGPQAGQGSRGGQDVDMDRGREACGTDVMKFCGGPGAQDDIISCLRGNKGKLSPTCAAFVAEEEGRQSGGQPDAGRQGARQGGGQGGHPCMADKTRLCPDKAPGRESGRCLRARMGQLSPGCAEFIRSRMGR